MAKDTRQKLINTAKELINASSYASVGVAEICKQAEVNKGSFYHFFESKEELGLIALEDGCQEHEPQLREIFADSKTAMQQLDTFVKFFYEYQEEEFDKFGRVRGCPAVNLGSEMATQSQHFCDTVNKIMRRFDSYFIKLAQKFKDENLIDNNVDVELLGRTLHTHILGLKIIAKLENNPLVFKQDLKPTMLRILGVKL